MALSETTLACIFSILVVILRFGNSVLTPLFLDSLNPSSKVMLNVSGSADFQPSDIIPGSPSWERIDPFFEIWFSMGFDTILLGTVVAAIMILSPGRITEREKNYPKSSLMLSGSSQAFSALLFQFSTSGTRTAPFLTGVLGYFSIPIAFILRFFMLHKRPSRVKIICAIIVIAAEFVSLIPIMFPALESDASRRSEGGSSGIGRILWPICFVSSSIPHAIWTILLEKSVKDRKDSSITSDVQDISRLNIAYVMFWNFLGTFLTTLLLFWVDLIPGFGLLPDIKVFGKQLLFNIRCIFGASPRCGFHQLFTGWGRMICKTSNFVFISLLLRYGEGANYYAILSALMQPFRFLFFTVFDEQPFRWHPHASLSTWLSVVALVVMVPTVVMYTKSKEETTTAVACSHNDKSSASDEEGTAPLLSQEEPAPERYGAINT